MKLLSNAFLVGLSLFITNIYASESELKEKVERACKQTIKELIKETDNPEDIEESRVHSLLLKNLAAGNATNSDDEIIELKRFYLSFIDGTPDEYKEKLKESAQGLDLNQMMSLTFDLLQSTDSKNYLNYLRILKSLPKELQVESQKRTLDAYNQIKEYSASDYHDLASNISTSNYEKLPSIFRELIEYSMSLGDDVHRKYCECLKSAYIVAGKTKAKAENKDFDKIYEDIDFDEMGNEIERELDSELEAALDEAMLRILEMFSSQNLHDIGEEKEDF